jgi:TfoX/Sxy family transcriptional regulator of competence genes
MAYDVHLADRIRSILQSAGEFSERKMFGGLAFMVNGHMCCGVLKTDLVLRLTPDEAATSLRQPYTRPMDFTGKPMKSMIYVSATGTDSDEALAAWVESAVRLARSIPEKKNLRRAATPHRITSSGLDARGPALSKSGSTRAARKRG